MYEALLKATEYQKIAASFASLVLPRCSVCRPQAHCPARRVAKKTLVGCCAS